MNNIKDLPIDDTYSYWVFTGSDCARFEPRLATDEFWSNEGRCWRECGDAGQNFYTIFIYRRRIDPGAGWEIVPLDEVIGDAECLSGSEWRCFSGASWTGKTVGDYFKEGFDHIIAFRRRKSAPKVELGGWISVKTRLPETNVSVLAYSENGDGTTKSYYNDRHWRYPNTGAVRGDVTHWMPLPAPPKPEPSADEVAFEKWWIKSSGKKDWISSKCDCLDSWQAALAYARKGQPQ